MIFSEQHRQEATVSPTGQVDNGEDRRSQKTVRFEEAHAKIRKS